MITRLVLGSLGAAVAAYGAVLLLTRQDLSQLVEVAIWLGAGVVAHDALVTLALLSLAFLGHRLLPDPWRAPATIGLVVMGSLTLVAVPVLGRFGARPDNPTLLDRPYIESWLVLVALTVVAIAVAGGLRSRAGRGSQAGDGSSTVPSVDSSSDSSS